MPAVTLAGALALAGCGGGDTTTIAKELTDDELNNLCGDLGFDSETRKCNKPDSQEDPEALEKALKDAQKYSGLIGNPSSGISTPTSGNISSGNPPAGAAEKKVGMYRGEETKISAEFESDGKHILIDDARKLGMSSSDGFHTDSAAKPHEISGGTEIRLQGEFNGVSGNFVCTGTCTSGLDANDKVALSTNWRFYPADEDAMVDGPELAKWGWWIDEKATPDVAKVFYGRVSGQPMPRVSANLDDVGSSAKYEGSAHGLYAIVRTGENDSGSFDATASLTAKFGAAPTISGKVSDFEATGKDLSGWEVTLHESALDAGGTLDKNRTNAPDNNLDAVWKSGTTTVAEGGWEVQAYGADMSHPSHILGAFQAGKTDGDAKIIGAFGTKKE